MKYHSLYFQKHFSHRFYGKVYFNLCFPFNFSLFGLQVVSQRHTFSFYFEYRSSSSSSSCMLLPPPWCILGNPTLKMCSAMSRHLPASDCTASPQITGGHDWNMAWVVHYQKNRFWLVWILNWLIYCKWKYCLYTERERLMCVCVLIYFLALF